jgi:glycosyltransferase involved in cell wall biosynthesis
VIPVYNERESILPLWKELRSTLQSADGRHEVIFVDDGSDDGSLEVLFRLRADHPEVRVLRARHNAGQTAAMLSGFRAARGEIVVTLDGDGQNDPADIPALLQKIPEYDAAVGYRNRRADNWIRRLSSRLGNAVRNTLTGDDIIDTGCTLKAFRRECLAEVPALNGMHRFLPTLVRIAGFRVCQIPVGHRPRVAGRSKYGIGNRLLPTLGDLLAVRWMKKRRVSLTKIEDR